MNLEIRTENQEKISEDNRWFSLRSEEGKEVR